jgi:hypothetical protein
MDKKPAPAAGQEHRNLSTITSKFALVQQTFLKKTTILFQLHSLHITLEFWNKKV